uniref:Zinc finger, CCHC-type n=1 Tax=Strongyloides papillosus TaxID=174720 RepID=A0A0N5C5U9_STREA
MDDLGKTRNSAGHTNKEIYNIDPPLSEGRGTQNQQEVHNNVQNLTIDKLLQRMELMMKVHIETMTSIQNSIKIQADNMLSLREKLDSKENLKKEKDESPSISQLPVNEDLEENATKETSQTIISYVNSVNEVKNKESKEESESDEIEISSKRNRGTPKGLIKRKPGKPKESTTRKKDTTDKKLFQKYADLFGQIFKICNSNNLLLNIHKSKFFHAELKYLAYTLNRNSYTQSLQCVAKLIRKATSTMTTFLDSLIECKVNWIEPLISTIYNNKFKVGDYFKK